MSNLKATSPNCSSKGNSNTLYSKVCKAVFARTMPIVAFVNSIELNRPRNHAESSGVPSPSPGTGSVVTSLSPSALPAAPEEVPVSVSLPPTELTRLSKTSFICTNNPSRVPVKSPDKSPRTAAS